MRHGRAECKPNAKLVGVLTTCAFENTQHRFQWSSSKYTRVVSAKSGESGVCCLGGGVGAWRLAVSVERASCCVGPSVAVCVAVCERLRREVWRVRPVPGPRARGPSHGDRARSLGLASSRLLCVRVRVAAARRDVTTCMFGPGRARGRTEIREVNPKERKPVACARKVVRHTSSPACVAGCRGLLACS